MIKFLIVYKVKTKNMHKKVPLSILSHMMWSQQNHLCPQWITDEVQTPNRSKTWEAPQHGRNFKGKRSTILRDNSRFKHCPSKAKHFSTAVSKPASAETNTAVRQTTEGLSLVTELNQLSHTYLIKQFRFIPMYILLLLVLSNSLHTL